MVAAADRGLIGDCFEEGGVRVEVDKEFYGSEEVEHETVVDRLSKASIANLVGDRAVEAGIKAEAVDEENVLRVEGVPHAQMVRI